MLNEKSAYLNNMELAAPDEENKELLITRKIILFVRRGHHRQEVIMENVMADLTALINAIQEHVIEDINLVNQLAKNLENTLGLILTFNRFLHIDQSLYPSLIIEDYEENQCHKSIIYDLIAEPFLTDE